MIRTMDSSPQSSLPSPPSSPASSFSSLPSSLFSSLPASPPSPLPLVLPSLLVQHDTTVRNSYIILGSQPSLKLDLLDLLDIQAINIDFNQSDNIHNILNTVYNAIFDRFQTGLPLISSHPSDLTLRDFVPQFRSHFFTAAILVLSSLKPTRLERHLITALSQYIPVIPVAPNNQVRRLRHLGHPQPLTPLQLRTILSHSPQALYKIQQKAARCFLSWHYFQSVDLWKPPENQRLPCYPQYPSITLDPLHFPSLVLLSFSLCKSFVSSLYVPPKVFAITVIGAFCAGISVGCYWARG